MAYVIPRTNDCILGGTAEEGAKTRCPTWPSLRRSSNDARRSSVGWSERRSFLTPLGYAPGAAKSDLT